MFLNLNMMLTVRLAATELARRGGIVHLLCRSKAKGEEARDEIMKETGNDNVHLHVVDISNPDDIEAFAITMKKQKEHDDKLVMPSVLLNNAGCMVNEPEFTPEGLEKNFATNTVGTYLLTELMLPLMARPSRIVSVSSGYDLDYL